MPNPNQPNYGRVQIDTTKKTTPRGSQVQTDLGRSNVGGMKSGGFQFGGNSSAAFRVPETLLGTITKNLHHGVSAVTQAVDYANDWVETSDRYSQEELQKGLAQLELDEAYQMESPLGRARMRQARVANASDDFVSYGYKQNHELQMINESYAVQSAVAPDAKFTLGQMMTGEDWDGLPLESKLRRLDDWRNTADYTNVARPEVAAAIDAEYDNAEFALGQKLASQNEALLKNFQTTLANSSADMTNEDGSLVSLDTFTNLATTLFNQTFGADVAAYGENERALLYKFTESMAADYYSKLERGSVVQNREGHTVRLTEQLSQPEPEGGYTVGPEVLGMTADKTQGMLAESLNRYAVAKPDGFHKVRARALAQTVTGDPGALRRYLLLNGVYEQEGPAYDLYMSALESTSDQEFADATFQNLDGVETVTQMYQSQLMATVPTAGRGGAGGSKKPAPTSNVGAEDLEKVGLPIGQNAAADATTKDGQGQLLAAAAVHGIATPGLTSLANDIIDHLASAASATGEYDAAWMRNTLALSGFGPEITPQERNLFLIEAIDDIHRMDTANDDLSPVLARRVETELSRVQAQMEADGMIDSNKQIVPKTPEQAQDLVGDLTSQNRVASYFENATRPSIFNEDGSVNVRAFDAGYHRSLRAFTQDLMVGEDQEVIDSFAAATNDLFADMGVRDFDFKAQTKENKQILIGLVKNLYAGANDPASTDTKLEQFTLLWQDIAQVATADPTAITEVMTDAAALWVSDTMLFEDGYIWDTQSAAEESPAREALYKEAARVSGMYGSSAGSASIMGLITNGLNEEGGIGLRTAKETTAQYLKDRVAGFSFYGENFVFAGEEFSGMGSDRFTIFDGTAEPSEKDLGIIVRQGGNERDAALTSGMDNQTYSGYALKKEASVLTQRAASANAPLSARSRETLTSVPATMGNAMRLAAVQSYIEAGVDVTSSKLDFLIDDLMSRSDDQLLSFFKASESGRSLLLQSSAPSDRSIGVEISPHQLHRVLMRRTATDPTVSLPIPGATQRDLRR